MTSQFASEKEMHLGGLAYDREGISTPREEHKSSTRQSSGKSRNKNNRRDSKSPKNHLKENTMENQTQMNGPQLSTPASTPIHTNPIDGLASALREGLAPLARLEGVDRAMLSISAGQEKITATQEKLATSLSDAAEEIGKAATVVRGAAETVSSVSDKIADVQKAVDAAPEATAAKLAEVRNLQNLKRRVVDAGVFWGVGGALAGITALGLKVFGPKPTSPALAKKPA
jgi:chromosome segregation ATPase